MKSRTNGPFVIYMEMEPNNTRPIMVWASHEVLRKKKPVIPFSEAQHPDNYLVRIPYCPENSTLFTAMTLKAWEEDLYDEGNRESPWYPLIGLVVSEFMEFQDGKLYFLPGETPDLEKLSQNENAVYAAEMYFETQHGIEMKIEKDTIHLSVEDFERLVSEGD